MCIFSDVANGSLRQPIDPNRALDDINSRIRANRKEQDSYLTLLAQNTKPDKKDKKKGGGGGVGGMEDDEEVAQQLEDYKKKRMAEQLQHQMDIEKRKREKAESLRDALQNSEAKKGTRVAHHAAAADESEEDKEGHGHEANKDGGGGDSQAGGGQKRVSFGEWVCSWLQPLIDRVDFLYRQALMMRQLALAAIPVMAVAVPKDDGLSALSADMYAKIRLLPMAAFYSKKAPGLAMTLHVSAILGVVLSVASSALSTFDLSVYIPAALAVSGAVTAWTSYQQIDLRLLQTNAALNQLNQLLVWWDGLTMIEKRVPSHKETLVKSTEACIQAQATIFSGGGGRRNEDDDEGDGDDDKGKRG